jgi:hypothetical protein
MTANVSTAAPRVNRRLLAWLLLSLLPLLIVYARVSAVPAPPGIYQGSGLLFVSNPNIPTQLIVIPRPAGSERWAGEGNEDRFKMGFAVQAELRPGEVLNWALQLSPDAQLRPDTCAVSTDYEGSCDGSEFPSIAIKEGPTCCDILSEHDNLPRQYITGTVTGPAHFDNTTQQGQLDPDLYLQEDFRGEPSFGDNVTSTYTSEAVTLPVFGRYIPDPIDPYQTNLNPNSSWAIGLPGRWYSPKKFRVMVMSPRPDPRVQLQSSIPNPERAGPFMWSSDTNIQVSYLTNRVDRLVWADRLLFFTGTMVGIIGALAAETIFSTARERLATSSPKQSRSSSRSPPWPSWRYRRVIAAALITEALVKAVDDTPLVVLLLEFPELFEWSDVLKVGATLVFIPAMIMVMPVLLPRAQGILRRRHLVALWAVTILNVLLPLSAFIELVGNDDPAEAELTLVIVVGLAVARSMVPILRAVPAVRATGQRSL